MKKFIAPVIVIILIVGFFGFIIYKDQQSTKGSKNAASTQRTNDSNNAPTDTTENTNQTMNPSTMPGAKKLEKPQMTIDPNKTYTAVMHTDKGDITIALTAKETPVTVNNFVYLSRQHFYDNTIFHRVIKGFMIQGGDPTGTGAGSPGYKFDDEKFSGEYDRGTVAMANAGPNTNGSQFFIMHQKQALPPNYVIFGKVTDGMDTVDKIAESEVTMSSSGEQSKPVTPTVVKSVDITEQ